MTTAEIAKKMIGYSRGNLHDIDHFLKVYAYARTIGECEELPGETQRTLEAAAPLHDIACPLCREKYGNTNGKHQEAEGAVLAEKFLAHCGMPPESAARVVYLVAHHHTPDAVDGPDYQILLEADYLVNAEESAYSKANIQNALERLFRTETGRELLRSVYLTEE